MQKHNLCKIITLMLEGTTKATYTAKTNNSLEIYLIHVIQTLPQTPTQSHSCNFPWCFCTAMALCHRKALWHWWHHVCCAQDTCPTSSTLLTGCGWGPWHGWTLSDHGQELLLCWDFSLGASTAQKKLSTCVMDTCEPLSSVQLPSFRSCCCYILSINEEGLMVFKDSTY